MSLKTIGYFSLALAISALFICTSKLGLGEISQLPEWQVHPLPPSLAEWQTDAWVGDYFAAIEPDPVAGYLIWWQFPVQIYLETQGDDPAWQQGVLEAIAAWGEYFPLKTISTATEANIVIKRETPPLNTRRNPHTGKLEIVRARTGLTSYQLQSKTGNPSVFTHRMTIYLKPGQSYPAILNTALHELGHALGIWGHSSRVEDVLYFAQQSQVAKISSRDVNTLKKVYQQPTRLGAVK